MDNSNAVKHSYGKLLQRNALYTYVLGRPLGQKLRSLTHSLTLGAVGGWLLGCWLLGVGA